MTKTPESAPDAQDTLPHPLIRRARRFPVIWVIPLVAALIGAGLIIKALRETGPTITIVFDSAESLVPGKTQIRYKDVVVGDVETIQLSDDLSRVEVVATMSPELTHYLTEDAVFWVVRARVAAGEVTGIGTLLSGSYIGMEPGTHGKKAVRHFSGLEKPPAVFRDTPGQQFHLRADRLGSLDIGSPVYYRQVRVGRVSNVQMATDGTGVLIEIFVEDPYHHQVSRKTRFYNASGLNVNISANGLQLDTPSVASLLIGGISFFTVEDAGPAPNSAPPVSIRPDSDTPDSAPPVSDTLIFTLYDSRDAANAASYNSYREYYLLYFDENVRGLSVGAPVEFQGIKIGEVVSVRLTLDQENLSFRVPVRIAIEPGRFGIHEKSPEVVRELLDALVKRGLRAEQRMGNFITGQSYVSMTFYPNAPPKTIQTGGPYPVFPTMPSAIEEVYTSVRRIMEQVSRLPLEETLADIRKAAQQVEQTIGSDSLKSAIENINTSFSQFKKVTGDLDATTLPKINEMLEQAKKALAEGEVALARAGNVMGQTEPLVHNLNQLLMNLQDAVRTIQALADYLERHPDAIVFGKGETP
ncbi:MlaD family protein [Desulfosarcina sp. OttesenSCG-928-G10]|nr:MlaD family protein [Desulfosarcina sp. OttesenSCG-928-G10]MDL2321137.1 MlaD family protein [Desulfosarcina sp. OttesenSCG-928-B08]